MISSVNVTKSVVNLIFCAVIVYRSVVLVAAEDQSRQACYCHDDILQQGQINLLLFHWVLRQSKT